MKHMKKKLSDNRTLELKVLSLCKKNVYYFYSIRSLGQFLCSRWEIFCGSAREDILLMNDFVMYL